MPEQPNLDAAREEFFTKEGGVGRDANYQEAKVWLTRALESLNYPTEEERRAATEFGCFSIPMKFTSQKIGDFEESCLSRAEDFLKEERGRLSRGEEAPWL